MSEAGMDYLVLNHVKKHFGAFQAVEDFELAAARGEFVSFLGPSGCGKTTTLRMIAGFERPDSGTISVGGRDITQLPPNKRNVGMVFQAYALFPNMTVASNIGFGMRVKRRPSNEIKTRVGELLDLINLPDKADRYPWQLSGGQQQRVALARALAISPDVLLLDEPLSALDAKIRVALRNEIRAIQRQLGITTVYVTHDQEEALSLSDRVVVMSQGRMEQVGAPFEIYNFPATRFVASFIGTLNLVTAGVIDAPSGRISIGGQEVTAAGPITDVGADHEVTVALRPEGLRLGGASDGQNELRGAIEDVAFLGSVVRVRVNVGSNGGPTLHVDTFNAPHRPPPVVGENVTVAFPREACLPLGQSSSPGASDPAEA
jgi:putative spermidine/putrescine transport system ATP-binding protein